jgi:hypothetical protein
LRLGLADWHHAAKDPQFNVRNNDTDEAFGAFDFRTGMSVRHDRFPFVNIGIVLAGTAGQISMLGAVKLPAVLALTNGWLSTNVAVHMATNVGSILRIDSIIFLPVARSRYKKRYP